MLGALVALRVVSVCPQDLGVHVRPNLVLWLSADEGIEALGASKSVMQWRDLSGGRYVFGPLSAAQHRAASARWKTAVARQRAREGNVRPTESTLHFAAARLRGDRRAVSFPAPLIANNVQFRDGITAFFVVTPKWLLDGDQAIGQRFFGHYPYGQFRFYDGRLGFRTETGNHVHSTDVAQGETILAAYRFDGNVQMSLNGQPFEVSEASKKRPDRPPTFSMSGYVTLGGCPPHNSFVGDVAEIMVFGVPLGDREARHVAEVMAARHGVQLAPSPEKMPRTLPQSHTVAAYVSQPAIPALPAQIDGGAPPQQREKAPPPRAADRVPAYRRIKERAKTQEPTAPVAFDLLAQLREAQARLTQLQDAVHHQQQQLEGGTTTSSSKSPGSPAESAGVVAPPKQAASTKTATTATTNACLGGDAFAKVSITKWTPPGGARLEDIQQWTEAKSQSDAAIKSFPRGGKELRVFVHKQVQAMRLLRHNLFCALV